MSAPMQLVLFDIDGTLLMGRGVGREATRRALLEVFGTSGTLDTHHFGGKTDWHTLAEVLAGDGFTAAAIGQWMGVYEQALARHTADLIPAFTVEALPGALDTVTALRHREDMVIGIVTGNVAATAPLKLQAAGFDPLWFPIGAYGSEALHRNDLPALALERATAFCGQPILPGDVTVIGDTEADIACARALGARAVAVTTGFAPRDRLEAARPDHLLDDLTGLLPLLG